MPFCPKCGKEVNEGVNFCSHCGANISEQEPTKEEAHIHRIQPITRVEPEKACFGPPGSGTGLWGAMSGGVFLIGLAILWYYDLWWPGILFLIAIMVIIGGLVSYLRQ
jgi:hypothetical protein